MYIFEIFQSALKRNFSIVIVWMKSMELIVCISKIGAWHCWSNNYFQYNSLEKKNSDRGRLLS